MVLIKTFSTYLLLFWLTLVALKLFSQVIFSFLNIQIKSRLYRLACELLFGIVMVVLAYSVYVTHFHTVFTGLLIPLGLGSWFFVSRNTQARPARSALLQDTWKDILVLLAIATPLYAWEFYQLFDVPTMGFKTTFIDYYYYACMSNGFNYYGVENDYGVANQIAPALIQGTSPYHYAEIWLNAAFSRCFGIPAMLTLMFVCYPLLDTIMVVALLSTWEVFGPLNLVKVILTYLLILMNGFSTGLLERIAVPSSYCYIHLPALGEFAKKLTPVYAVVACTGMFYYRGKPLLMLFCFTLLSFFYLPMFPAVLFSVFIVSLTMYYMKSIDLRTFMTLMLLSVGTGVFLLVYFALNRCDFKNQSLRSFHPHIAELLKNPRNIVIYKDIILLTIFFYLKSIISLVLYVPVILLYIYMTVKKTIRPAYLWWLLVFAFLTASDLTASLMNPIPDSIQFFTNALPAFSLVLIYAIIALVSALFNDRAVNSKYGYAYWITAVYLALVLAVPFYKQFGHQNVEKYSAEYVHQCKTRLLHAKASGIITFLRTKEDFAGTPFDWMWKNTPGILAFYYGNPTDYTVLNLADAAFYRAPDSVQLYRLKQQPLYIYDKYGRKEDNRKENNLALNFVKDYHIKFIFSKGENLPESLYPMLLDSVRDSKSGEVCYQLK